MVSSPLAKSSFHPLFGNLARTSNLTWNSKRIFATYNPSILPIYTEVQEMQTCLWGGKAISRRGWQMRAPPDFNLLGIFLCQLNKMLFLLAFSHAKWYQMKEEAAWLPRSRTRNREGNRLKDEKWERTEIRGGLGEWEESWWERMEEVWKAEQVYRGIKQGSDDVV